MIGVVFTEIFKGGVLGEVLTGFLATISGVWSFGITGFLAGIDLVPSVNEGILVQAVGEKSLDGGFFTARLDDRALLDDDGPGISIAGCSG